MSPFPSRGYFAAPMFWRSFCSRAVLRKTVWFPWIAFGDRIAFAHWTTQKMASTPTDLLGNSGCRYRIEKVLREPSTPAQRHVYLATAEDQRFILKAVSPTIFEYFQNAYSKLNGCPNVRHLHDTIPNQSIFVHKHFRDHLLNVVKRDLPIAVTKKILKDTLRGIAALHDQQILHGDVKADNIMVDYESGPDGFIVQQVQLADIEDGVELGPKEAVFGKRLGNIMWRSPEAHAQGPIQLPTDIFSFAIVCIYAVHKQLLFAVDKNELSEGEKPVYTVIERQLSYFADPEALDAFVGRLDDDSPWRKIFKDISGRFVEGNPRKPVALWEGVDPDFKDLLVGLTKFDPRKRLTAHEALAHKWFTNV